MKIRYCLTLLLLVGVVVLPAGACAQGADRYLSNSPSPSGANAPIEEVWLRHGGARLNYDGLTGPTQMNLNGTHYRDPATIRHLPPVVGAEKKPVVTRKRRSASKAQAATGKSTPKLASAASSKATTSGVSAATGKGTGAGATQAQAAGQKTNGTAAFPAGAAPASGQEKSQSRTTPALQLPADMPFPGGSASPSGAKPSAVPGNGMGAAKNGAATTATRSQGGSMNTPASGTTR